METGKRREAMDERFIGLETRLAYQEKTLADLSAQAFEVAKRVERLEGLVRDLSSRLKESSGDGPPLREGERPPHY